MVRYKYCIGDKIFGYYVCDVKDFKDFWRSIRNFIDWCVVDIGVSGLDWCVCDCWVYYREWKINGWYQNGWKFLSGK